MSPRRALATLLGILLVAAVLRWWGLSTKPAWLDEAMTMLIAAGRGPDAVPIGRVVPLAWVRTLFAPEATGSASDVIDLLRPPMIQHTHPPLFYVITHGVLASGVLARLTLTTVVRIVSVVFGMVAIVVMYFAARDIFNEATALLAAALSAVSPYGVALSQEARNYTLGLVCVTVTVWATIAITRRMAEGRSAWRWWGVWAAASAASWYSHYFSVLASGAQVVVLADAIRRRRSTSHAVALVVSGLAVVLAYAPWIPILRAHLSSPEQQWMLFDGPSGVFTAVGETFVAWHTMLIGRPWFMPSVPGSYEATRIFGIAFIAWALVLFAVALVRHDRTGREAEPVRMLLWTTLLIVAEYAAAMIIGHKDLVTEARYHFPYYPSAVMLLAWALWRLPRLSRLPKRSTGGPLARALQPSRAVGIGVILAVSALNGAMVSAEVEDWKPPETADIVARFDVQAPVPVAAVAGVGSYHEVVNALATFLEWSNQAPLDGRSVALVWRTDRPHAVFGTPFPGDLFFDGLERLEWPAAPATLWIHDNGLLGNPYPSTLRLTPSNSCVRVAVPAEHSSLFESDFSNPIYRRYRCGG